MNNQLTKSETKELKKILTEICSLDNKMADIVRVTGKRQTIVFSKTYRYIFLHKVVDFFKSNQAEARTLIGSAVIQLQNCTVRIYRKYEPITQRPL